MSFYGDFGIHITDTINEIVNSFFDWKDAHPNEDSAEFEAEIAETVWELVKLDTQANYLNSDVTVLLYKLKGGSNDDA